MIANIVEVILVDNIGDLVDLNARLLRINLRLPADVDDRDALVCDEQDEQDGYANALG